MPLISAGILVYRLKKDKIEVLLVKAGGPFFRYKKRSWSIPKGQVDKNESFEQTALREFEEETSLKIDKEISFLGKVKSNAGKEFICFFTEKDFGFEEIKPTNPLTVSLKIKNSKIISFPEIEKVAYWDIKMAKSIIFEYQIPLLDKLQEKINS